MILRATGGDGWSFGSEAGDAAAGTVFTDIAGDRTLRIDYGDRSGRFTTFSEETFIDGEMIV